MNAMLRRLLWIGTVSLALSGCQLAGPWLPTDEVRLVEVASSTDQWTGLAVSKSGRIFVNFPLWSESQERAVGEFHGGKTVTSYPDLGLNSWAPGRAPGEHFVCVQALLVDDLDRLWVLDPANPRFGGVVPGGPKLLCLDLERDVVIRVYRLGRRVVRPDSYLNDVRLDLPRQVAYLTDSGNGALIVLDLATGAQRRVLDGHSSTQAEDITLTIDGEPWLVGGQPPRVHADGIALSRDRETLYYQALTGTKLYSIATSALRDPKLSEAELAAQVQMVAEVGPSDGLICGPDGAVYLTSLEENAIRRVLPDGTIETVIQDPRISWPDSFAIGGDGRLYFTTAQIHRGPNPPEPYRIYRLE